MRPGKQDVKKREASLSHESLRANQLLINHLSTTHNPDAHTARFTTQRGPYGNAKRALLNRKTPLTAGRHQHSKHFSSAPQPAGTAVDTMQKAGLASGIAHSRNAGDTNPNYPKYLLQHQVITLSHGNIAALHHYLLPVIRQQVVYERLYHLILVGRIVVIQLTDYRIRVVSSRGHARINEVLAVV